MSIVDWIVVAFGIVVVGVFVAYGVMCVVYAGELIWRRIKKGHWA